MSIAVAVAVADSFVFADLLGEASVEAGCLLPVAGLDAASFFGSVFFGLSLFSLTCPPPFFNDEISSLGAQLNLLWQK